MSQETIKDILAVTHAIINESHVVYTSGKHGLSYINKDAIYPHTSKTAQICYELTDRLCHEHVFNVDVVVGPALGGIILSQWIAYHFSQIQQREVLAVYAEKDETGNFVIKRGYDKLIKGKKVLVVEDVLNTGGSVKKVVEAVRVIDGEVVGVGAICNRGKVTKEDVGDVPLLLSLVNIEMESWEPEECPLCQQNIPINTDVGKGREFLAAQK